MIIDNDKQITVKYTFKSDLLLVFYRGRTGIEWNWLGKGAKELKIALTSRVSTITSYINPNMINTDTISLPIKRLILRKGEHEIEIGIASTTPYERKALTIDIFRTLKFRGVPDKVTSSLVAYLELNYEICERD